MFSDYATGRSKHSADHGNSRFNSVSAYRGRTEEHINFGSPNISQNLLHRRDLQNLEEGKTMGNIHSPHKNAREKSTVRKTSSSSHSVSNRDKFNDNFENGLGSTSTIKRSSSFQRSSECFSDKTSPLNGARTGKPRRNSSDSDSGYNSSGKVCETDLSNATNGLQQIKLPHNPLCGFKIQSEYNQSLKKDVNHFSLTSRKPDFSKQTGSRESLQSAGKSSRKTSVDLDRIINEKSSMLPKLPKSGSEGLVGLQNLGNTCFMNSILQCLSHCWPLRDKMLSGGSLQHNRQSKMKGKLFSSFAELIKTMWSRSRPDLAVSPQSFKMQIQRFSPRFVGYDQQDSQEFLRFLLEGLNEDLNLATGRSSASKGSPNKLDRKLSEEELSDYMWEQYKSRDDSLVTDLFCGQIMSTLTCTKCSHRSVMFDPFWDLSLPIPRHSYSYSSSRFTDSSVTLLDCLKLFTKKEELDGDEKPKCERCKTRQKCQKQIQIHRFPRILVIHLKRFSGFGFRSKLQTDVVFPLNHLDMSTFASRCSNELSNKDSPCVKYNLFAVSNHIGSAFGGHYTAYCKHPESKEWHSFNDSRVGALSSSSVRGSQAYVLFYERSES